MRWFTFNYRLFPRDIARTQCLRDELAIFPHALRAAPFTIEAHTSIGPFACASHSNSSLSSEAFAAEPDRYARYRRGWG